MNHSIPYLGGSTWNTISREERLFCAELYFPLSRMPSMKPFIAWLTAKGDELHLRVDDHWSVGYEVCFYRDMIHAFGLDGSRGIRKKQNADTGQDYMPKRTFDLALFHPKHIVIIEAKAQQGLDRKQLAAFARDEQDIRALLASMGRSAPMVHTVLLAKDHYVRSPKGLAKDPPFKAAFSWKEIGGNAQDWGADARALAAFDRAEAGK